MILNVLKLNALTGFSNVLGPITTAYSEPIIKPIIVYIVGLRYFSKEYLTPLIVNSTPNNMPIPNKNTIRK